MPPRWLQAFGHLDKLPELWRCVRRFENWATMMGHFFDLPGARYPAEARGHGGFRMMMEELCDVQAIWETFCRDQYQVPADAKTIVDIGANIGVFTIWAARRAPAARVFSFEPFPQTFNRLVGNVRSHGLESRVTCHQQALSASGGRRAMSAQQIPSAARSLLSTESPPAQAVVEVPTLTFAQLLDQVREETDGGGIDVVKMDIEGAEHEVLPNIEPRLLAGVDLFALEYHPNGPKRPLFEALERAGLACVHDGPAGEDLGVAHFARLSRGTGFQPVEVMLK